MSKRGEMDQRRDRLMALAVECDDRGIKWKEFKDGIIPPKTTWRTLTDEMLTTLEQKLATLN